MGWGCLVVVIFLVRYFLLQSYRISTLSMKDTLSKDDYVLVNKLHGKDNPGQHSVVLLISPLLKDTLNTPLLVSRCVGMPGDTLQVTQKGYFVNGKACPFPPAMIHRYRISVELGDKLLRVTKELGLPRRYREVKSDGLYMDLTSFESYLVRGELTSEENLQFEMLIPDRYEIVLPRKNIPYRLQEYNLPFLENAIRLEAGELARFRDGKLILDGVESAFFTFSQDYCWVLSDNTLQGIDSRHLGIIPENHIVGNVWFCWYSKNKKQFFKWIR
ncbi:MAG: signal peptidase I [Tannerellaceae bacterium]|nr:signal peptidase I [Tannerellaceae bacterium]